MRRETKEKKQKVKKDPFYIILDQHLFNGSDLVFERDQLVTEVVNDYLLFLRKNQILIPIPLLESVKEELRHQVDVVLAKKMYGFIRVNEFRNAKASRNKREAQRRYSKLVR